VLGLFVIAWQKRRRKSRRTLEQWAKEEARAEQGANVALAPRVHIVLPGQQPAEPPELPAMAAAPIEAEVPKVEHEGQWHTLH
jgi:hypothetical protein